MIRTQQTMMALILDIATRDDRIRAVFLNGSRANDRVKRDAWQDYDIVFVVTDLASFLQDPAWIDVFGSRVMVQEPALLDALKQGIDPVFPSCYTYLMLFADGNRVDLTLETIPSMEETYGSDSLTVPLLDKDGILPVIPPASDTGYWVKPPAAGAYASCTNDFWWCMQNVGKGLRRQEFPYAWSMYEQVIRPSLDEMVSWWIGGAHAYRINVGKFGKWFSRLLPADLWAAYERTYAGPTYVLLWEAIFAAGALFERLGLAVAAQAGLAYPLEDAAKMRTYLQALRAGTTQDGDGDVGPVV